MIYKCHVYYPGLYYTPKQAKYICDKVYEKLKNPNYSEYHELFCKYTKIIDSSVYNTGLRLLGSHKGNFDFKIINLFRCLAKRKWIGIT